jgi:N-acetylglutamate synthase-like GNAT family acetyltransferase
MPMKLSFSHNPVLSEGLFDLLDTVFPGVRRVAQNAKALGAPWESVSTPFVCFDSGRVVAHVGVIELSLVVLGQSTTVGTIHGVATHPQYRHRGYYRQLMEEVLQHCEPRYGTLILTTEHPEYFLPFGFRVVQEHLFTVQCNSTGIAHGCRLVNTQDVADVAMLHRLLEARKPVSTVVGVVKDKAVFCFNEGSRPLYYAPDLDVLICLELERTWLKLFDIVGANIPPLATILDQIPQPITEVAICFSADCLAVEAQANPYVFDHDGPSYLMVRGPFAAEGQTFTLPRSART